MSDPVAIDPESLQVTNAHDIYPGIDPTDFRKDQAFKGKVVLVTGASRGIGKEIAFEYARCGATLAMTARSKEVLEDAKADILKEVPTAVIGLYVADVVDVKAVESVIKAVIAAYGRLDVAIANAGKLGTRTTLANSDCFDWWKTFEVHVRGTFNLAHFAIPELVKTQGYFIMMSSMMAQIRFPDNSDYTTSKHALNRLNEYIHLENPAVKSMALHPGAILTDMTADVAALEGILTDSVQLPACTLLRLTSGREDWLSGRYISVNWNLDEVQELWKDKILKEDALVNRLRIPQS